MWQILCTVIHSKGAYEKSPQNNNSGCRQAENWPFLFKLVTYNVEIDVKIKCPTNLFLTALENLLSQTETQLLLKKQYYKERRTTSHLANGLTSCEMLQGFFFLRLFIGETIYMSE
jgi:hypothetical protein